MEEQITISKKEYDELLKDQLWLQALEQSGLDIRVCCSDAANLLDEWEQEGENIDKICKSKIYEE